MRTPLEVVTAAGALVDQPLVLVDVGAAGAPPAAWGLLAPQATYIAFDPDAREMTGVAPVGFRRSVVIDKAVTDVPREQVTFHLTASPQCSSLLRPDRPTVDSYGFSELFEPVRSVQVPAVTLDQALDGLAVSAVDWLKLDTQGKDLDLYASLRPARRERLLAVDVEPGLLAFYEGENTFTQVHEALTADGFWLAHLETQSFPRVARSTRQALAEAGRSDVLSALEHAEGSPTAAEARYLRTTASLERQGAPARDWAALWLLAMAVHLPAFALEVAAGLVRREPGAALGRTLYDESLRRLSGGARGELKRRLRDLVPAPVRLGLSAALLPLRAWHPRPAHW